MTPLVTNQPEFWPALPLESWKDTYATLHMWTQMVGKWDRQALERQSAVTGNPA